MMRALLALLSLAAMLALTACYNTGDLGSTPFTCSADFPQCPDTYTCLDGTTPTAACGTSSLSCICALSCGSLSDCPTDYNTCNKGICAISCKVTNDCPLNYGHCTSGFCAP